MDWILLGTLAACGIAIAFFVVTIFSLHDMIETQRRTEDRLRESEERLRAVVDNSRTLISVKEPSGRYVMVNRRFESVLGLAARMTHGRRDEDLFPLETAAALRAHDDTVIAGDRCVEFDQSLITADGRRRRFSCVKTPLHDSDGNVAAVCSIATDVTERELARRERDRIFELSPDMMAAASIDGYLRVVNPQWERVTGFTAAELLGSPGIDFVHPEDREEAARAFETLRRGEHLAEIETRLRRKNGSYARCRWRIISAVEEGMVYAIGREIPEDPPRPAPGSRPLRERNGSSLH
jgi:PAS domain S-box-containing protein